MQNLALIKLGGSVVTFKETPLAANINAIENISKSLSQLAVPMIVVHGGGSFGHYWSVEYKMHAKPASYDEHGVSIVHESMVALNQIIVNSMIKVGLNPYGISPSVFTSGHEPIFGKIRQMHAMARAKMIPVTFGDVVHVGGSKYSILSGDALMTTLAIALRPSKVIFATNVDGLYQDLQSMELVREIDAAGRKKIEFPKGVIADVTGGMQRKITEAFKIASYGIDVLMVNGLRPERIAQAVEGDLTVGTKVKGR
ncbi:MAG: isopentenyl phosphate kinase [Nitrososphaera sp.]